MIIVDFSQLCVANYMTAIAGKNDTVGDLDYYRYTVLNSLRHINTKFRSKYGRMIIAMDSGVDSWRKEVFPYYKARRKIEQNKSAINWAEMKIFLCQLCKEFQNIHWQVVHVDRAEADDIIAVLTKSLALHEPTVIVSQDKDFIQLQNGLTSDQLIQWDTRQERQLISDNPAYQLFELVIKGDSADGIPNVFSPDDHYISENTKRAKPITKKLLEQLWDGGIADVIGLPGFKRNVKLIDFNRIPQDVRQAIEQEYTKHQPRSKSVFVDYLNEHDLSKLYKHIGDF